MSNEPKNLGLARLLPAGMEWKPKHVGWIIVYVASGTAYWRTRATTKELPAGGLILSNSDDGSRLLASRLGDVEFSWHHFRECDFPGLFSIAELRSLELLGRGFSVVFSEDHPITSCVAGTFDSCKEAWDMRRRAELMSAFCSGISSSLDGAKGYGPAQVITEARTRLRLWLAASTGEELLEGSVMELAQKLNCSVRHLSRLFVEETGCPYRQRQTHLRMQRAQQLLKDSNRKVLDVAMDCGYRNLSLFNSLFRRRFGMTPTEWRRRNTGPEGRREASVQRVGSAKASVILAGWMVVIGILICGGPLKAAETRQTTNASASESSSKTSGSKTNAPSEPTIRIVGYNVVGNTLLNETAIKAAIGGHTNETGNFELIRKALASLQLAYRNRGWATVSLTLPQQRITNGIVTIQVTEGRLADVTVTGNKWFSERNIRAALPSAKTNTVLNSKVFQAEVDQANTNPDRQIYPVIEPGAEPGTSILVLKVKDQMPLHGRFELNNQRTPGTPQLRGSSSAQYNNLWDRDHTLGLQYGFAMQQFKDGDNVSLLDRPAIANYSTFYRMPLNSEPPIEEVIRRNPNRFGFDEGSRQFRLPPPSRRSEINFYASRFTTDTGTKETALRQLNPPPIELLQNESGQDLSTIQTAGIKLSTPVPSFLGTLASVTFGAETKSYSASSFNTNNFLSRTTFQDPVLGPTTLENRSSIPQTPRYKDVAYLPLSLRADVSRPDRSGITSAGLGVIGAMAGGPFSTSSTFERILGTESSGDFAVMQASLARQQRLPGDWTMVVRADGQWATQPLLPVEQFGLGGLSGVRGYLEGARFGDAGWRVTAETKMPSLDLGVIDGRMPVRLVPSVFMDYGQSFSFARTLPGATHAQDVRIAGSDQPLWGSGIGVTGNVGSTFDFRLSTAWALESIASSKAGTVQLYFGIAVQF